MSKTLLLADDSVTIQKVVGISLANEDVRLITVDNGDDAVLRAHNERPDAILADVVMPGKNGYEVCEAIKADPALRHIPVLLLSGTFETFDEERARNAGASGHIAKPFESQVLVERVKALLSDAPAAAPPAAPPAAAEPESAAASATEAHLEDDSDDAFDFFDDDLEALSPPETAPESSGGSLEVESTEAAFAFDDDELPGLEPEPTPTRPEGLQPMESTPAAPTIAILGDEEAPDESLPLIEAEQTYSGIEAVTAQTQLDEPRPAAPEPLAFGSDDDLDFAFDSPEPSDPDAPEADDSLLRVDGDDLAQATVLDPQGASGYDVSSSDLGDPLGLDAPSERPSPAAEPSPPEPELELASPPELAPSRAPAPEPASSPESLAASLAPGVRAQLHDTLEKIAWESFGEMTEVLVRQALERVEAIAWEVIPQMAETLIREEIRRLKDEGEG